MKEMLLEQIKKVLEELGVETEVEITIPKDSKNGDFTTNVALKLASVMKKNPRELATSIISKIKDSHIEKIEIAGPGFINFYFDKAYLFENVEKILKEKENYGRTNLGKGKKINVEYVSANPTGILHLGHARGASYGDALTRILSFNGYEVDREYYINDAGNQIENLEKSIQERYRGLCGLEEHMPENGYYGKEIIDIAKELKKGYGDSLEDPQVFKEKGLQYLLDNIKNDLHNFRVDFDIWSSERDLYKNGYVNNALEKLKKSGYTYEQDGAIWLKTSDFKDEKDRVLVKKDKTNTYFLPDISYHQLKLSRGYDEIIDVLGADHHGYIARIKASIAMFGENPDKLDVEIIQMVRLVRGKEEIKMSKRTGNAVTINDLVEEVGLDATRYFFAARSIDTQMDFDMELATKQSNENPVYYIQYANARICSILREHPTTFEPLEYHTINSEYAYDLLTKLYNFSNVVEMSAQKKAPNLIANYVYDLASSFHTFYSHEKVLTEDLQSTMERLHLIKATSIVITNALNLIGVSAPERM